ncbi:MAG TPA: ABC transporter substrate-binding protein, partial [Rhodospirillales bacterium]|nr:ABC transporter substrate-binding protein [Rhodospirillales bacterium]
MNSIKKINKLGKISVAAVAALIGLVAEASAQDNINIGVLRFTSHSAAFIAYEKGYFKEAGLSAKLVPFQAAAPMAVAIASGDIDYGVTAISGALVN